ncbi:hypothetical protein GCM10009678_72530 [Actinomadura kijaniata]
MSDDEFHKKATGKRRPTDRNRRRHLTPRRRKLVSLSFSDEEYAVLTAAARRERLATGAYIARAALAASRETPQQGQTELRELLSELMRASGQARRLGVNLNQAVAALHAGELTEQLRAYAQACARTVDKLDAAADEVCRRLP